MGSPLYGAEIAYLVGQHATIESEAIDNVLGGRKVLRKTATYLDDLADLIGKGVPASSVRSFGLKKHEKFTMKRKVPSEFTS